jgi:lipopolysaccharide export system permease protein
MLLRLHGRTLLITLVILVVLALVGEFFETARHMFSGKGSAGDVVVYFLCKFPTLVHMLLPISLVVSICVVFALLGRNLELRALAAAGVGPARIATPIMVVAGLVVLAVLAVGEFLVPPALDRIEKLMQEKFGRFDATWRFFPPQHWYQGQGDRIFRVGHRAKDGHKLFNVILLEMDEDFHVKRRTDVQFAYWDKKGWKASKGYWIREFENSKLTSCRQLSNRVLDWPESPDLFRVLRGRPKQKPLGELSASIAEMEHRGQDLVEYRMELHNRFAYPALGFMLVLLIVPWLSRPSRRLTLAGALTEAMGLIFGAYFLVGLATALVSGRAVSPATGVWFPVAILAGAALVVWIVVFKKQLTRT